MVTWRCEYRWLLFFWPVFCVLWLVATVGSLYGMARTIDVFRESDHAPTPWRALLMMSCIALRKQNKKKLHPRIVVRHADGRPNNATPIQMGPIRPTIPDIANDDHHDYDTIIVRVELRSEAHLRWWITALQTVAMAIYLYATFILSSVLFLTGQEAISYAITMTLSLSAIRIMSTFL